MKSIATLLAVIVFSVSALTVTPSVKVTSRQQATPPGIELETKVEKVSSAIVTPVRQPEKAPEPVAPVAPAPRPVNVAGCEQWRGAVSQYGWNVDVALAVMKAESGCNPNADNVADRHQTCMGSRGLFQIGCNSTSFYARMFEPQWNMDAAWSIYSKRGWRPWGVCTSGKVNCF